MSESLFYLFFTNSMQFRMSTSGQSSSGSTKTEFACSGSSEVSSLSNFFRNSGRSRYFRSILIWNIVFLLLKSTMQSTFVTAETTLQDSFHEITSLFSPAGEWAPYHLALVFLILILIYRKSISLYRLFQCMFGVYAWVYNFLSLSQLHRIWVDAFCLIR